MSTYVVTLFLLCSLPSNLVYGQTMSNVSVEFTRTVTRNTTQEVVKGSIYYQSPGKTVIIVHDPISQWMVFQPDGLLIYYPNERQAFRFRSKSPFALPFFEAFVGIVKDDFGLSEAGFTLSRSEVRDAMLLTYWKPPKRVKGVLGHVIIGLAEDRLVLMEMRDAEGKTLAKTTYSKHIQYGETFFPLEVVSVQYQKNNSIVEKVVYTNPQFNAVLPGEVVSFAIPMDVEVKEVKW